MSTPIFVRTSVSTNNSSTRGGGVANKFAMAAATSSSLWLVEKTRSGLLGKRGTGHRRFHLSDKHCSWLKRSEYTASRQRFPRCLVFSRSPKACASALSPRINRSGACCAASGTARALLARAHPLGGAPSCRAISIWRTISSRGMRAVGTDH
jgi:hypothetical protein